MPAEFYDLNAEKPALGAQKPLFGDDRSLIRAGLILLAMMTVWRFYIGLISHVIWEEGHFVVSGAYFALGYPDIPAGYPWIARLLTAIFG
ncbi:MAG: glycosyltransferase, partial [Asticcacaulis sp.]|nr:glycosyltransferase [Asticcacaulis sp.]